MTAFSVCSTFHELSLGGVPTSIKEGSSRCSCVPCVVKRKRIVRGLTKVIEKGSEGFSSYSVPGNSVALPFASVTSILLNESVVLRKYLAHSSKPSPVDGLKFVTRLPIK